MNNGWIKLHRKILNHPYLKGRKLALWTTLLLLATHQDREDIFGGEKIILKAGQFITGRKYLAEKSGYKESGVEGALAYLEKQQQIRQQKSNQNRLITVNNWSIYQGNEQQDRQQNDNKKTRTRMEEGKEDIYISEFESFSATYQQLSGKEIRRLPGRLLKFKARRMKFSFEELVKATANMLADPFMCGVNNDKKFFATVEYILRNDENVEKYLDPSPTKQDDSKQKKGESTGDYVKRTLNL